MVIDGGDDLEDNTYGNTSSIRRRSQSELIPVDKLEWYNRTNVSLIKKQYEVSSGCQSGWSTRCGCLLFLLCISSPY